MPQIKSDKEFEKKLEQLSRFYRATRAEFSRVEITQSSAPMVLRNTGKIVDKLTEVLSEIELYSGAADIRLINAQMKEIRAKREGRKDE